MYEVDLYIETEKVETTISKIKNLKDLETLIDYGYVEIKGKNVILKLENTTITITFNEKKPCNEDVLDGRNYYSIKKVTGFFVDADLRRINLIDYFPFKQPFGISLGKVIGD